MKPAFRVRGIFRFLSRSRCYGRTVLSCLDGSKQLLIAFGIDDCDLWPHAVRRRFIVHPVHKRHKLFFGIKAFFHELSRATQLRCPFVQKHTSEVRVVWLTFGYIETLLVNKVCESLPWAVSG